MLKRVAIGLMLALLVSGCGTMKAYEGPELPKSEIAVLHHTDRHGEVWLLNYIVPIPGSKHISFIDEIDGKGVDLSERIHILPGQHSARVTYQRNPDVAFCVTAPPIFLSGPCFGIYQTRDLSIDFTAEAGHEYRIPAERRGERNWIWVEDVTSGKVVAGEKPPDEKGKGKDLSAPPKQP